MPRLVTRVVDVRPGEWPALILTFLYVALAVASFLLAKPIRNGLFLAEYGAQKLVYVYVAVPLALSLAVPIYARVAARRGLRTVYTGSLLFFCANVLLFWYLFQFHRFPGIAAAFYVWVNCFGIIAPVQAWSFVNAVFDVRQARRLFGLIGSGASMGAIVGGLLAERLAHRIGTVNLLLVLAALIALACVVVNVAWGVRRPDAVEAPTPRRAASMPDALAILRGSSYLQWLALMVFLVAIVTQWTQFQFSLTAEERFAGDRDGLTRFFGTFNYRLGIAAFLIQVLVTGPLLRQFGVAATILILPLALAFGQGLTVLVPGLLAVLLTNGFDQALRFSIDKATFELLYQPLPGRVKSTIKPVIDVLVNRLGDGLGGVMLGLATGGFSLVVFRLPGAGLGLRGLAAVTLGLISVWLVTALALRRGYVAQITQSIKEYRFKLERESAPMLDRSAMALLNEQLETQDPRAILYALHLFEQQHQHVPHPAVRSLLTHASPVVRARAVSMLNETGDRSALAAVEPLLRDPDLEVRTQALLYLAYFGKIDPLARLSELGDFEDFSIRAGMVSFLAQPGSTQNLDAARMVLDTMVHEAGESGIRARVEAAYLIGRLPNEFGAELASLIADPNPEVARHALTSAATLGRRDLVGLIVNRLGDERVREAARATLVTLGPSVMVALNAAFSDPDLRLEIRNEIPDVLAEIATPRARAVLTSSLLEPETTLRFRVISALNRLHRSHPHIEMDRQAIDMVLTAEVVGHYRSYQILAALGPAFPQDDPVAVALRKSMEQEMERIFRLMSLRWPEYDMHSAHVGLTSNDKVARANALEFLDNILQPHVRALLVPLFDAQVSVAERAQRASQLLGTSVESQEQAVAALVAIDDPWLRSCGAYAIGALRLTTLAPELDRLERTDDPLLKETVRAARQRLTGEPAADVAAPATADSQPPSWQTNETMGVG